MARYEDLEELLRQALQGEPRITEKGMFDGCAWRLNGHLLCGARDDGMLARLREGEDAWARQIGDIVPMSSIASGPERSLLVELN